MFSIEILNIIFTFVTQEIKSLNKECYDQCEFGHNMKLSDQR